MHEALHDVTWEGRRLWEYVLVAKAAFDTADGEAAEAKAAVTATDGAG
jgi:hypothetical protein